MAVFPRKQSALVQCLQAEFVFQAVAQEKAGIGSEADTKFLNGRFVEAASGKIFASPSAFGTPQAFLEKSTCALVDLKQRGAQPGVTSFGFAAENGFGQRNAELLGDRANRLRKRDVLNFLDEAEHVAGSATAKAVIELARGVH